MADDFLQTKGSDFTAKGVPMRRLGSPDEIASCVFQIALIYRFGSGGGSCPALPNWGIVTQPTVCGHQVRSDNGRPRRLTVSSTGRSGLASPKPTDP